MSSSLATQLAKNASLNASLLSSTRRKPVESYLFPASQASTHDLESIHFLASNAFLQLKSVQPSCRKYEAALFSDSVKDVDRTLLSKERNEELDVNLKGFLRLLGPWLMEGMVGKILEWLVRRFRCDIKLSIWLPSNWRLITELTNSMSRMCWFYFFHTTNPLILQRCSASCTSSTYQFCLNFTNYSS